MLNPQSTLSNTIKLVLTNLISRQTFLIKYKSKICNYLYLFITLWHVKNLQGFNFKKKQKNKGNKLFKIIVSRGRNINNIVKLKFEFTYFKSSISFFFFFYWKNVSYPYNFFKFGITVILVFGNNLKQVDIFWNF